jgi:hypothetical protein
MPRLIFGPQIFQIGIIPPVSLELMVKLLINPSTESCESHRWRIAKAIFSPAEIDICCRSRHKNQHDSIGR